VDEQYTVARTESPLHIKLLDFLVGLTRMLGLPFTHLERDQVLAHAKRRTGLSDWGDESFIDALDRLLATARSVDFTWLARAFTREICVKAVSNRLKARDYLARNPDARSLSLQRPVFILGFPRTGTTLLQNLLCLDPTYRALRFWELTTPVPLHEDPERDRRTRRTIAARLIRMSYLIAPEQRHIHEISADTFEECWPLFVPTFCVLNFDLQSAMTGYGDWLLTADMKRPYREYRSQLQILAHRAPPARYVLKCPEHLWFLDALMEVFPDACIVWTHRDPLASVASYCSLISLNRRMLYGRFEPAEIGAHIADRFRLGVERAMAARAEVSSDRFYDVDFHALVADPGAVVQRIQRHFDLPPVDPERVTRYLATERGDSRGKHRYSADRYGLDPDAVHAQFAPYIEKFGIRTRR